MSDTKRWGLKLGLVAVIICIMIIGIGGLCNKKDSDDAVVSSSAVPVAPSIVIVGEIGLGYESAYIPKTLFEKFCNVFTDKAYAEADPTVNKVIAIPCSDGSNVDE